jgi:hypothetical protein
VAAVAVGLMVLAAPAYAQDGSSDVAVSFEAFAAAIAAFAIAIGPAAKAVQKGIDLIRDAFDDDDSFPKATWVFLALSGGVGMALLFQFNFVIPLAEAVPALARGSSRLLGAWGQVFTGLGIGGFASYWHERDARASAAARSTPRPVPPRG